MPGDERWRVPNPQLKDWDVVIIGTGVGGSTLGFRLAASGHRVLFVEKGRWLFGGHDRGDGTPANETVLNESDRLGLGLWPTPIDHSLGGRHTRHAAILGCGTGGSSGLYGAQLERFMPSDFERGEPHPSERDAALPASWPISYGEFAPYYRQAELLYAVNGTPDPLHPDSSATLEPPPMSMRDRSIFASLERAGLHPYRPHVAYDYAPNCIGCPAALCPSGCKRDAARVCLLPAIENHSASIVTECEALRLEDDGDRVTGVRCLHDGQEIVMPARLVVLAAGAIMSPRILLASRSRRWPQGLANRNDLVGRHLMVHASELIAIGTHTPMPVEGPKKSISLNDFYSANGQRLGTIQTIGADLNTNLVLHHLRERFGVGSRTRRRYIAPLLRLVAAIASHRHRGAALFGTVLQDLPYARNRVRLDARSASGVTIEYDYPEELRDRNRLLRRLLLGRIGKHLRTAVLSAGDNLNFGHPCGTCRSGDDPATSVLDRDNRAHDLENLYVVDASFFPTSGGTNPALTIAANALRVADVIGERLEGRDRSRPATNEVRR